MTYSRHMTVISSEGEARIEELLSSGGNVPRGITLSVLCNCLKRKKYAYIRIFTIYVW